MCAGRSFLRSCFFGAERKHETRNVYHKVFKYICASNEAKFPSKVYVCQFIVFKFHVFNIYIYGFAKSIRSKWLISVCIVIAHYANERVAICRQFTARTLSSASLPSFTCRAAVWTMHLHFSSFFLPVK